MAFDGFVISNLVYELNNTILNAKNQQNRAAGNRRAALHLKKDLTVSTADEFSA